MTRLVSVIAICYNHARFVIECLESIGAQTFQDFELIVADDCSSDHSADLIAAWLARNRPDAVFIRHRRNAGMCPTLNETLAHARGQFVSMIATDDAWLPDKIARQLAAMRSLPERVAVVYSDAARMDEAGAPLTPDFIESHRPGLAPPSGRIFPVLADGNFIPAMATLIRRQAIVDAGGYDERLSYEDYNMWLYLAQRHDFVYCPGALARYRIVSTSMVRTLFERPSARHYHTLFLIRETGLRGGALSAAQRRQWAEIQWVAAYQLYVLGDARARACLWTAFFRTRKPRAGLLALACALNISRARAKRLLSALPGAAE